MNEGKLGGFLVNYRFIVTTQAHKRMNTYLYCQLLLWQFQLPLLLLLLSHGKCISNMDGPKYALRIWNLYHPMRNTTTTNIKGIFTLWQFSLSLVWVESEIFEMIYRTTEIVLSMLRWTKFILHFNGSSSWRHIWCDFV